MSTRFGKIVGRRKVLGRKYGGEKQVGMYLGGRSHKGPTESIGASDEDAPDDYQVSSLPRRGEERALSVDAIQWVPTKKDPHFFLDCQKVLVILADWETSHNEFNGGLYKKFATAVREVLVSQGSAASMEVRIVATGVVPTQKRAGTFTKLESGEYTFVLPNRFQTICHMAISRVSPRSKRSAYSRRFEE
jgi:hypothetical protein